MGHRRALWSRVTHPLLAALGFLGLALAIAAPSSAQVVDGSGKLTLSANKMQEAAKGPVRMIVTLTAPASASAANNPGKLPSMRTDTAAAVDGFIARSNARRLMAGRLEDRVKRRYNYFPLVAMELSLAEASALATDSAVVSIVEDAQSSPSLNVSIPLIKADQVTAQGPDGYGQTVAIFDTGVDFDQVMLAGKIIGSACFSSTTSTTKTLCPDGTSQQLGGRAGDDCVPLGISGCEHGTHVAGIAAGRAVVVNRTVNGVATPVTLRGVAPSASIVAVQVFSQKLSDNSTTSFSSDQIAAFDWLLPQVAALHIASINMSLGGSPVANDCDGDPRKFYIDQMRAVGVLTAIAAGNDGSIVGASSPGCITGAMTVGATDNNDALASFTNSGVQVDLWAPGVSIESSIPTPLANGTTCCFFQALSGTSMSTPHVAGAIALLKSAKPTATAAEIENALKTTGPIITDSRNGLARPRLDVLAAFNALGAFGQSRLTVSPDGFTTFMVPFGGTPSPATRTFTVTNTSGNAITARAAASNANITLAVNSTTGTSVDFPLAAGGSASVTVTPNLPLPLDIENTEIAFSIVGGGATITRGVRIDVNNPIAVAPASTVTLVGPVGGPFQAIESTAGNGGALYTVTNSSAAGVTVNASVDQTWATLSAASQTGQNISFSAPVGQTQLVATATPAANSFGLGAFHGLVTTSISGGVASTRPLDLRVTVANDLFINAANIPQKGGQADPNVRQATGSTVNSFYELGEPAHLSGNAARRSVWYWFTPTVSGQVQVDTIGSTFDTVLAVYTGSNLQTLTQLASNDDITNGVVTTSKVTLAVSAGTTYYVAIDGFAAATGNYTLNVTASTPANDLQANAQLLSGLSGTVSAISNTAATASAGEPRHAGAPASHSVWYRWIAQSSGQLKLDTLNNSYQTVLAVYQPTSDGGFVEVGADVNTQGAGALFVSVAQNHIYYIAVDGVGGASGVTDLTWEYQGVFSSIVSSTLPSSRRTVMNRPVTIFANMINTGATPLTHCAIAPAQSFPGTFSYQTADGANQLTGTPNTDVTIPGNTVQNFVLTAQSSTPVTSGELGLYYTCLGDRPAVSYSNLNTWLLRVDPGASTPDVIAIGATAGTPGVVTVPLGGAAAFSVASVNIGATSAAAGTTVIQLQTTQPNGNMTLSACETNPGTGACLAPPSTAVAIPGYATNAVHTFSVFVQSNGQVTPFDPASNRIAAVFKDADGNIYGATSVAVRTQ